MSARLEIFTLGGVRVQRAGAPVSGLTTKKAEALLIYLVATRRPQPREVLAELLWDDRLWAGGTEFYPRSCDTPCGLFP